MLHEWVTLTNLWMLYLEIVYSNLWECFVVRKLQYMITVILIVVLKSCLLGRNYLFLGSEQKIYFTFMNYVRWPTVLIFPELRNFLWYRIFSFKTGRIWGNGNDFVTESLWHFLASSVQLLSCVQLFATPWTAACQASMSITNSRSLLKLTFMLH